MKTHYEYDNFDYGLVNLAKNVVRFFGQKCGKIFWTVQLNN